MIITCNTLMSALDIENMPALYDHQIGIISLCITATSYMLFLNLHWSRNQSSLRELRHGCRVIEQKQHHSVV